MALMKFFRDEKGVTAIEYGLIAALIAVACLVAFQTLGDRMNSKIESISGAM